MHCFITVIIVFNYNKVYCFVNCKRIRAYFSLILSKNMVLNFGNRDDKIEYGYFEELLSFGSLSGCAGIIISR